MRSGMKYMAVAAALLLLTAGSQGAFAGCTNFGPGFADLPVRVRGLVRPAACRRLARSTPVWWMVNYGNLNVNTGLGGGGTLEGTGNQSPAPSTATTAVCSTWS